MSERDEVLVSFLGAPVGELLRSPPFSAWHVSRSTEEDLPKKEIWYEFEGHGVEVICDEEERIRTIFLHRGDGEALAGVPFTSNRRQVLDYYGIPTKSGEAVRIPVLGDRGAWDRFCRQGAVVHIQYLLDRDEIDMVTYMRPDYVP